MDKNRKKSPSYNLISCNVCGKTTSIEKGVLKADMFEATKEWGYFSKYDLEVHKFNICEECYDSFIQTFKIPINVLKKKEVL